MLFKIFFDKSGCKPNKIWVDKDSEFYNRSMKSLLQDNIIDIAAERFIKTSKNKIYKHMATISKNIR